MDIFLGIGSDFRVNKVRLFLKAEFTEFQERIKEKEREGVLFLNIFEKAVGISWSFLIVFFLGYLTEKNKI